MSIDLLDDFTGPEPTFSRPLAGHVNICLSKFKTMKSNEFEQWLATLKHELIHAFVFSPPLFKYFPNAGRPERTRNELMTLVPNVVHRFMRFNWETLKGPVVHDVYMIVTPKVREEVRRHFNCSTLEGAELENQGGRGTVGAHWEKRIFENEAMSGVATQVYALSRLTLALFEDSGWYKVNYDKAEDMLWGRNLGCTFAKKSCLTWMKLNPTNPYPFCRVYEDSSVYMVLAQSNFESSVRPAQKSAALNSVRQIDLKWDELVISQELSSGLEHNQFC